MNTGGIKLSAQGVGTVTQPEDPRLAQFRALVDDLIGGRPYPTHKRDAVIAVYRQAIESK